MVTRPLHKSLNRRLTICGVERKLFFSAAILGAATFNFFSSFLAGVLIFASFYIVARRATATDPQNLRILMNASRFRAEYDPGKKEHYRIARIRNHGAI